MTAVDWAQIGYANAEHLRLPRQKIFIDKRKAAARGLPTCSHPRHTYRTASLMASDGNIKYSAYAQVSLCCVTK